MSTQTNSAPSWLFSFVDLAFLLLLAVTQLGTDEKTQVVDLGEIAVPRLPADGTQVLESDAPHRWQLRVYPAAADSAPYELLRPSGEPSDRMELTQLADRLHELRRSNDEPPLLAPHSDSRTQDMLEAVSLLEVHWQMGRRATVIPEYASR
jgi:hypothetical protein